MSMLRLGGLLNENQEVVRKMVIHPGERFAIDYFAMSGDVEGRLVWKYGTESEEIIWVYNGRYNPMKHRFEIPEGEIDGVNQIAVVVKNPDAVNKRYASFFVSIQKDKIIET